MSQFPLHLLPDELVKEVFSHLPQADRLNLCLLNKYYHKIATQLLYNRIYLNDSNVVKSDYINLAINWSLINIPSSLSEKDSREIANKRLEQLIETLENVSLCRNSITWIRINWDLDSQLQKRILNILCDKGESVTRLENITDPNCNDIIMHGKIAKRQVISFDLAPPNALPEVPVSPDYIPNAKLFLKNRISSRLSHMTLFIDPVKLFNYLYPLKNKLQIVDLKLHWRSEFYQNEYFTKPLSKYEFTKLSEIFDVRTLKVLTVISWNQTLLDREIEMVNDFKEFTNIEDLSLISIKQKTRLIVSLFKRLKNLKRLKMDFLEDFVPESTNPEIFIAITTYCRYLQFMDLRFQGLDPSIISLGKVSSGIDDTFDINSENRFILTQTCNCDKCDYVFKEILKKKIFLFEEDYIFEDISDIASKDIYKMMRCLSLLPYSKACDYYPSVRTQPMNLKEFVKRINTNLWAYRQSRDQLILKKEKKVVLDDQNESGNSEEEIEEITYELPHDPLSEKDVIDCYHALIHQYKSTYITFLSRFKN
ncbi:hypothetical protein TPHA_0E03230 [Tetrapisispora phaffii CBS 4417]|uniref:F-box domain-containing protein n=1 Tax=Tetrapisispora phaffii (strain ATCC 24235 / CBS 4417 / NBRC 1672 / NRRL Y-8282 / UCD 70-5) TaxID=1071381 RepID=G8BU35_TETPH|nr:hypothetical protein TPHA_0E03230 [Tetrapisispora phaffii CBS 4417]CCE63413.1 hypothetical protein TPHA_0E03230 [Tetrapisispora phaffii CBS 4417]